MKIEKYKYPEVLLGLTIRILVLFGLKVKFRLMFKNMEEIIVKKTIYTFLLAKP